jgi:hypothetical protein
MKKTFLMLALIALWLAACSTPGGKTPGITSEEVSPIPTVTSLALEDEWRIIYQQSLLLSTTCSMLEATYTDYSNGEIGLERALVEFDAEDGFVRSSQGELSLLTVPSEGVAIYLAGLEEQIQVLEDVFKTGEQQLAAYDWEVWDGVFWACTAFSDYSGAIHKDAQTAGLSLDTVNQFYSDIAEEIDEVYESTQRGRSAGDTPQAEGQVSLTPGEGAAESGGDQEQLLELWRPAYTLGALLYETCTMTYNTHADYGQGVIGMERAQVELEAESNFVEYVMRGITSTVPGSEQVASHLLEIETQANALVEWLMPASLELSGGLEAIERSCLALQNRMDQIYNQVQEAGISGDTLDELDDETTPIIEDLYDQTWYSR